MRDDLHRLDYDDTEHVQVMRAFMANPGRMIRTLLDDDRFNLSAKMTRKAHALAQDAALKTLSTRGKGTSRAVLTRAQTGKIR